MANFILRANLSWRKSYIDCSKQFCLECNYFWKFYDVRSNWKINAGNNIFVEHRHQTSKVPLYIFKPKVFILNLTKATQKLSIDRTTISWTFDEVLLKMLHLFTRGTYMSIAFVCRVVTWTQSKLLLLCQLPCVR